MASHPYGNYDAHGEHMESTREDWHAPHIKESRVGSFTDAALKHHEGVQAFASHILANPGDYSKAMDKKAQFAHNASEWHH